MLIDAQDQIWVRRESASESQSLRHSGRTFRPWRGYAVSAE